MACCIYFRRGREVNSRLRRIVVVANLPSMRWMEKAHKKIMVKFKDGVTSLRVEMKRLTVVGTVDPIFFVYYLRKKLGYIRIDSVVPFHEYVGVGSGSSCRGGGGGGGGSGDGGGGSGDGGSGGNGSGSGDGDEDKAEEGGIGSGGGKMKSLEINIMGQRQPGRFDYRYASHAGNENEYPVGQLMCCRENPPVPEASPWREASKPVYVLTHQENQLCTMKTRRNCSEVEKELGLLFSKGGKWRSEIGNQAKQSINGTKLQMLVEDIREGVLKAIKWSEQKEAVAELTKLASTKKIAPGDFTEVNRTLKKLSIFPVAAN